MFILRSQLGCVVGRADWSCLTVVPVVPKDEQDHHDHIPSGRTLLPPDASFLRAVGPIQPLGTLFHGCGGAFISRRPGSDRARAFPRILGWEAGT